LANINVLAVDVGSLMNIGWWRACPSGESSSGRDLDELVDVIAADLQRGDAVALGFEAPLFIPRPRSTLGLSRQRVGDGGRPWSAGAGTGALALGVQQAAYVFASLSDKIRPRVTFSPRALLDGTADLLIWEAFVSGKAKDRNAAEPHVDDARLAVTEFARRLALGDVYSDVDELLVLNLAAAGLIASGLTMDTEMLKQTCVVVKPPRFIAAV
jgi:hypothetical protein